MSDFELKPETKEAIARAVADWDEGRNAPEPMYPVGTRVLTIGRVGESNQNSNLYENCFHVGTVTRVTWSKACDCFMYTVSTFGGCPENTVISIDDVLRMNFRHDHASRNEDRVIRWYDETSERVE